MLMHEGLHKNAKGFLPIIIDEGMTQYLTVKWFMHRDGYKDFSYKTVLNYYKTFIEKFRKKGLLFVPGHFYEMAAALHLINTFGEEALLEVYMRDNYRLLEAPTRLEDLWKRKMGIYLEIFTRV